MTEDEVRKLIDEYAKDAKLKISKVEKALNTELDAILKEVISSVGKSEDN